MQVLTIRWPNSRGYFLSVGIEGRRRLFPLQSSMTDSIDISLTMSIHLSKYSREENCQGWKNMIGELSRVGKDGMGNCPGWKDGRGIVQGGKRWDWELSRVEKYGRRIVQGGKRRDGELSVFRVDLLY